MIIKKFQGKTESEAIEIAKKELGENIVIMNVKNFRKKKFFGIFGTNMVEVTVALESDTEKTVSALAPVTVPMKETSGPIVPGSIWEKAKEVKTKSVEEAGMQDETGRAIVEKLDGLQLLLQQQLKMAEEDEKREKKEQTESVSEKKEGTQSNEILTFMKLLYNTMLENEVNDKYANELISDIEKNGKPDRQMDYTLSNVYQKMILKFGKAELIQPATKTPKLIYFIGPTGVGKTTTIAKIASKFCVEEKKRIALLTADTYRIAAAEQLRTYASILEVPFRVIYTSEEIVQAVEEFKELDYILVDTSGHSHQNEEQKNAVGELISAIGEEIEKEVFLVVSATTKYRDLIGIADAYKDMTKYKIIFTKLDETTALGNLYNLRLYTGAALSYVTCGQNVPDDILPFNPQSTVKQILSSN